MWQINYNEMYLGNNKCFAGNTIAMYGGDSYVYCPNTKIVSNLNASSFYAPSTAIQGYFATPNDFEIVGTSAYRATLEFSIDDDDEEIGWFFNFNPGTFVEMTFNVTQPDIFIQVDDEDFGFTIPVNDTTKVATVKYDTLKGNLPSRGYKISFTTQNENTRGDAGLVSFYYNITQYAPPTKRNCTTLNLPLGCVWDFKFKDDFCILQYNDLTYRNWNSDYSPYCTSITQDGRDQAYTAFLFTIATLLAILIIIINVAVICFATHRSNSYQKLDHIPSTLPKDEIF